MGTFCPRMISPITADTLRAILAFIDPPGGPRSAGDNDSLADALVEKIKAAVGNLHGTIRVTISFNDNEEALARQFHIVAEESAKVFENLAFVTGPMQ